MSAPKDEAGRPPLGVLITVLALFYKVIDAFLRRCHLGGLGKFGIPAMTYYYHGNEWRRLLTGRKKTTKTSSLYFASWLHEIIKERKNTT